MVSARILDTFSKFLRFWIWVFYLWKIFEATSVTVLVDQVAHFLLTLSNLSNALVMVHFEKHRQLINKLISYIASKSRTRTIFGIISYIFNGIGILCMSLNIYFFVSFYGWNHYRYYFFKDFQFCFLNLTIYSISELFYSLRGMFSDLNQELLSIYNKTVKDNQHQDGVLNLKVVHLYKTPKCLIVATLRKLTKKHNELCHLADHLNDYVGVIAFLQIVSIVANIVWSVTVLVEYDIGEVAKKKIDPPLVAWICHIAYNLVWVLSMMGQTIFIALVGRALTQEGRKTSNYCYKILDVQVHQDADVKGQLILLAKQAETRCPMLSAAGFFLVDLEILGLVSANVFAFGIVAIQFVLSER